MGVDQIHSIEPYEKTLFDSVLKEFKRKLTERELFFVRSALLINYLISDLIILRISIAHRVSPKDLMAMDRQTRPDNIMDTSWTITCSVLEFLNIPYE